MLKSFALKLTSAKTELPQLPAACAKTNARANEGSSRSEEGKMEKVGRPQKREVKLNLPSSYPISLEVDENPSSDLGDQDEQQAREVLQDK